VAATPPAFGVSVDDGKPGNFEVTVSVDDTQVDSALKRGSMVLPTADTHIIRVDVAAVYSILGLQLDSGSELKVTLKEVTTGDRTGSDTGAII